MVDWTSIILALITLLGGCGWLLDRKKHRQEVEGLKADNRQKDMELGKMYVDEFRSNIADPSGRGTGHWHIKVNPSEVSVSLNIAA